MSYKAITTVVNLLSIISRECQYQEPALLCELNNFYAFDHNVFLLHSSIDVHRLLIANRKNSPPQSVYFFQNSNGKITGLETLNKISSKNVFVIMAPESVNFESNLNLLNHVKEIYRLKINIKIGVFFSEIASPVDLRKFFQWCWTHHMINIFVAFNEEENQKWKGDNSLNVFTFDPFGTFNVVNVSGKPIDQFFLSQNANFQQYPLRVGIPHTNNFSRDFGHLDNDELLWNAVFRVLNASITIVMGPESNLRSMKRSQLFENDTMDLIRYLYAENEFGNEDKRVNIYPILMDDLVLLIPESLPYGEFSAYLRTVTSDQFFGYSLYTIAVVVFLLSLFRYIGKKKQILFRSAADVINLLMNDNGGIKYQNLSRPEAFLLVPLTFVGFVIVNGILSTLQSYLTRPIMQPQIKTLEEIFTSSFPIFVEPYVAFTKLVLKGLTKHDWNEKVFSTNEQFLQKQIAMFNTSISFIWPQVYASSLLDIQKRLYVRGYHIPRIHIFKYYAAYPVSDNFPFIERINEIIHQMQSAGLWEQWQEVSVHSFVKIIFKKYGGFASINEQADIDRFPMPRFIIFGWCFGTILLIIEIVFKNFEISTVVKKYLRRKYI